MTERDRDSVEATPARVVTSFPTYDEAREAVDYLAARGFAVEEVAIVAGDLRFVEHVTGRRSYGSAIADGAAIGAATGAVLGFFLGLFSLVAPLTSSITLAFWGLIVGAVIGAIVGVIKHALTADGRGFSSVRQFEADRYDLVARGTVAERARVLLEERRLRAAA